MPLTETQRLLLSQAAQHPDGLAVPPTSLPPGPRGAMAKGLLRAGLVAAVVAERPDPALVWKLDGATVLLRITDAGVCALGNEAPGPVQETPQTEDATGDSGSGTEAGHARVGHQPFATPPEAAEGAPTASSEPLPAAAPTEPAPPARDTLRRVAQQMLDAWSADADLTGPMQQMQALFAKPTRRRSTCMPRPPRQDTKQAQVLALLRRTEGATVAQVADATGWQPHTVRGFLAGLRKRQGIAVEAIERVRQVCPDKQGARGSYTVYRVAAAA